MVIPENLRRASGSFIGASVSLDGSLSIETPVQLSDGTVFFETNAVGYLSYLCSGARCLNADIGRYVSIAENVVVGLQQHPLDRISTHLFAYHDRAKKFETQVAYTSIADPAQRIPSARTPRTKIGHDVWIGRQAIVMPGVNVGVGAVIGASAVVTKDVAPYTIVAGVPAKPLRRRFNERLAEALLSSAWWDYDLAPLKGLFAYTDISGFLSLLKQGIEEGTLQRLAPPKKTFLIEGKTCRMEENDPNAAA